MRVNKRKLLRLSAALLGALLFLLVAAYAFLLWESHRQRQKAEQLFRDLQTLKIGKTSREEGMAFIRKNGGELYEGYDPECGTPTSWYHIAGAGFPPDSWEFARDPLSENWLLNNLGVRPWFVVASVAIHGERVVCVSFSSASMDSDGVFLIGRVMMKPRAPEFIRPLEPYDPDFARSGQPSYAAGRQVITGPAEGLEAAISHEATPEQRARAFDINFDCLTGLRECRRACEMMPSVWRQLPPRERVQLNEALEEQPDPRCQAVLAAGERKPKAD